MTTAVLERALAEELTDHLGYEVGDQAGNGSGNSRDGYSPKKLLTEAETLDLDVTRDRAGTHEPKVVAKGQRRPVGIADPDHPTRSASSVSASTASPSAACLTCCSNPSKVLTTGL